ncbi:MAG: hypothetical protein GX860_10765, partial [Alcaligenaceae bacterium]|nr:hypothetical protein [Alcaligenaceae bacterium]
MEISKRVFPYPVLSDFTNDYKNSYFYNHIKTDFDVDKLIVTINCKLKNEQLNDLLNNQKLKIVHHFENSSTAFRRVYETFDLEFECSLSKKDVSGRMSIVSFLIVNEYISNYRNNDFVDILIGYTYDFDVGTTLG